jgi:hypothetical protein
MTSGVFAGVCVVCVCMSACVLIALILLVFLSFSLCTARRGGGLMSHYHLDSLESILLNSDEIEAEKKLREAPDFLHKTLAQLDGARRSDLEHDDRKKDQKRQKLMKDLMLPQYLAQIHKATDPQHQTARPKLNLPAPNISDHELQVRSRSIHSCTHTHTHTHTYTRARARKRVSSVYISPCLPVRSFLCVLD